MQKYTEKEQQEIIKECGEFLQDSSNTFKDDVKRQVDQLEMFGGNFWTDSVCKTYRRTNKLRPNLHFSNWEVLRNAAVSPFSASPWHIALENTEIKKTEIDKGEENAATTNQETQKEIDSYEADSDCKTAYIEGVGRGFICGAGYYLIGVEKDELTGQNKICGEFVTRQNSVAFDPNATAVDGSDAEQGAIVNYISLTKAKRIYGNGVVPMDYPNVQPTLTFVDIGQWPNVTNKIQVVTYYRKKNVEVKVDENKTEKRTIVEWFKICGNAIIDSGELPIRYIPIVRFAGFATFRNGEVIYTGIIDKTFSLQLGINIAYSTMVERAGRSVKANYITNVDSVDGLDAYYKKLNEDDSLLVMYKGDKPPIPVQESFVTSDLSEMIANTRNLLSDVVGIPLTGINGINESNKTATEVLQQQANAESNVANIYNNAYKATRTIGRIVIQLITGGVDLKFTLENGPAIISQNMKKRQELAMVASLLPDNLKPLMALYYVDTIKSEQSKEIKADIIANLPTDLKLVGDQPTDPAAIHELRRMQVICDGLAEQLEATKAENEELKKQYESAEMSLLNTREQRADDMERFRISETNKMNIETAKLESQNAKAAAELAIKNKAVNADMQRAATEAEQAAVDTAEKIAGGENAV
jgi:hypothetical protein